MSRWFLCHQAAILAHILAICMSLKAPGDIILNEHAAALLERLPVERRSEREKENEKKTKKILFARKETAYDACRSSGDREKKSKGP